MAAGTVAQTDAVSQGVVLIVMYEYTPPMVASE